MTTDTKIRYVYGNGISFGSIIAILISWTTNHSIGWAIVHGILSWFYIIYYLCGGGH